jgi:chromosome segregation ATPase
MGLGASIVALFNPHAMDADIDELEKDRKRLDEKREEACSALDGLIGEIKTIEEEVQKKQRDLGETFTGEESTSQPNVSVLRHIQVSKVSVRATMPSEPDPEPAE